MTLAPFDTADVVGIGFGPANLAFAIAMREIVDGPPPRMCFLEKQSAFGWHRGMLLQDATMQVSFLKDLVTMRNPNSPFSFLSYLHARGRLTEFINNRTFYPLRIEFHDYLSWAAEHFAEEVQYGCEVLEIRPVGGPDGAVDSVEVVVRSGRTLLTRRARNVVVATGSEPVMPDGVESGERVLHSSELLHRVDDIARFGPRHLVVVGAGQSAAEVVGHLHQRFPEAQVHAVFSRYGYSVADDSPFANRVFDPEAVDSFYHASPDVRQKLLDYHANTNYSVVDLDLINDLYRRTYRELVTGDRRLHVHNVSRLRAAFDTGASVRVEIESLPTGRITTIDAEAVVFATGYRPIDPSHLLGELGGMCRRDDHGRLLTTRDYRILTEPKLRARIYLQGPTEQSHGLSSGLLSTVAVRAGEIAVSLIREQNVAATGHTL